MYQLEVKRWLVEQRFPPQDGWAVTVDVDAMERGNGGMHPADKAGRTAEAERRLVQLGVTIGSHPKYKRADIVAVHPNKGLWLVEVEGQSSRQKEQAMYSALGQLTLLSSGTGEHLLLAVPDELVWRTQLKKIPAYPRVALSLTCVLVSPTGCEEG